MQLEKGRRGTCAGAVFGRARRVCDGGSFEPSEELIDRRHDRNERGVNRWRHLRAHAGQIEAGHAPTHATLAGDRRRSNVLPVRAFTRAAARELRFGHRSAPDVRKPTDDGRYENGERHDAVQERAPQTTATAACGPRHAATVATTGAWCQADAIR